MNKKTKNMKKIKLLISVLTVAAFATASVSAFAKDGKNEKSEKTLTEQNGKAVGKDISALFEQFKKTGTVDVKNPVNIVSLTDMASNLAGFKNTPDKAPFIKGLVESSKGLITDENANKTLNALGEISKLDLSSLGGDAVSGLFAKMGGKSNSGNGAGDIASDILSGLFKGLQ